MQTIGECCLLVYKLHRNLVLIIAQTARNVKCTVFRQIRPAEGLCSHQAFLMAGITTRLYQLNPLTFCLRSAHDEGAGASTWRISPQASSSLDALQGRPDDLLCPAI